MRRALHFLTALLFVGGCAASDAIEATGEVSDTTATTADAGGESSVETMTTTTAPLDTTTTDAPPATEPFDDSATTTTGPSDNSADSDPEFDSLLVVAASRLGELQERGLAAGFEEGNDIPPFDPTGCPLTDDPTLSSWAVEIEAIFCASDDAGLVLTVLLPLDPEMLADFRASVEEGGQPERPFRGGTIVEFCELSTCLAMFEGQGLAVMVRGSETAGDYLEAHLEDALAAAADLDLDLIDWTRG